MTVQVDTTMKIDTLIDEAIRLYRQDYARALEICQQAEAEARDGIPQYSVGIGRVYTVYAMIFNDRGSYNEALRYADEAVTLLENDERLFFIRALEMSGTALLRTDRYSEAMSRFVDALNLSRTYGLRRSEAISLNNLGILYAFTRQFDEAKAHYQQSLDIYREIDDQDGVVLQLSNLCAVLGNMQQFSEALTYGHQALRACDTIDEGRFKSINLHINVGRLNYYLNNHDVARDHFEQATELANAMDVRKVMPTILRNKASLESEPERRAVLLTEALRVSEKMDSLFHIIQSALELYDHYKQQGNFEQALAYHEQYFTAKQREFEERSKNQFQLLEVMHRTDQARQEAELYRQRNEILAQQRDQDRVYYQTLTDLKDETLRMVSHDLKSPLTGIFLTVDMLKRSELNERQKHYADRLMQHAQMMRRLIEGLLDLARMEHGRTLKLEMLDLRHFAATAIAEFEDIAARQSVDLLLQAPQPVCPILIDGERILQVFSNLLSNAIKYSPTGSTVTLTICEEARAYRVEIRDQGIGIAPEHHNRLFDRFYRIDEKGSIEGTGLGLAIVKSIVESHNGRVGVESTLGQGSTFWFTLPKRISEKPD